MDMILGGNTLMFVVQFGAALIVTIALVPAVRWIAMHYGVVARPSNDRWHRQVIPLLGGAAIVGGFLAATAFNRSLPWWLVAATLAMFVTGLVDDLINLTPRTKLLAQFVIVALTVTQIHPLFGVHAGAAAVAIEIFWLLALVNAVNLLDHLDGLAGGVVMIEGLAAAVILALHGHVALAAAGFGLAGACAGFLVYNFNPASIFMGDAGALALGFLLGILTLEIARFSVDSPLGHIATPLLVAMVPLMDTSIVTATRAATGQRISRGGRDHSSHRLVALGLNDRRAAIALYLLAALAAGFAVQLSVWPEPNLTMAMPFLLLVFALIGLFLTNQSFWKLPPGRVYHQVHRLARALLSVSYKWRLVEVILDALVITAAYYGAFLIKLNFQVSVAQAAAIRHELPLILLISYTGLLATRTYRGIWRFATLADGERLLFATGAVAVVLLVACSLIDLGLDFSIGCLFIILLFNLLLATRLSFRILARAVRVFAVPSHKVVIVGAGSEGEAAVRYFLADRVNDAYRMIGFVDDDDFKRGKMIHGYPVLGTLNDLGHLHKTHSFDELVVAEDSLSADKLAQVMTFADSIALVVRRFSISLRPEGRTPA